MKEKIEVRGATSSDLPVIYRLITELAQFEKLSREVTVTEQALRDTLFCERPYARALIGEIGGDPAGFALFFHNYSTFSGSPGLSIEDLYVVPKHRGKGVGKALLRHCAKLAESLNCGRMEWSVLEWNPARSFYEHRGARALKDWVLYRIPRDRFDRLIRE